MPTIIEQYNPFDPNQRTVHQSHHLSPQDWLDAHGAGLVRKPFICLVDGAPLLRKDWSSPLAAECSVMAFVVLPAGGGGGILSVITAIAVSVFAPPAALGGLGVLGSTLLGTGLKLASSLLIGSLFGSSQPRITEFGNTPQASPTYSLQARGNQARLGAPIPVIYGKHRVYPDYAAAPWSDYQNNEQYLYQLFAIGQGEYDINSLMVDDTPMANFAEVTYQIIPPGGQVTLFDPDYTSAPEVSGQELFYGKAVGGFAINPPDTETDELQVDIVLPRGLYYANTDGSLGAVSVQWRVEARRINNDGVALADWQILATPNWQFNTNTAQRRTDVYRVSKGRYEMRLTRLTLDNVDSRRQDALHWQAAKAKLARDTNAQTLTLLAVRMRATNNLSTRSRGLVNCIVTRKLPIWHASTGWSAPQATRSIAWAIADIARAQYGGGLADSRIDLAALVQLDQLWAARGDYCDAVFDQSLTVWEALIRVAKCGRAGCFLQGGVLRTVRDQRQTLPVAMFTPRNIVKGSLQIEYRLADEDTATSIIGEFHNRVSWKTDQVEVSLDDDNSRRVKMNLFGITDEAHVVREIAFLAKANKYRRKLIVFHTEMEGFSLSIGDLIAISHQMPRWGVGGEVIAYDAAGGILTLSEPVEWAADGTGHIMLRAPSGGVLGTYRVTKGASAGQQAVLAAGDRPAIVASGGSIRTLFAFAATEDQLSLPARVINLAPRGQHNIAVTALAEDNRVHEG